jgi:hypothetical protein
MNHPHDLLADLVDGTLDVERRAGVEAHLRTCEGCRADLAAATTGRDAARSLGVVPAPPNLHDRVAAAAGGGGGGRGWYRWAGAAAAAAVVVAIALALPNVGDESDTAGGASAARAESALQGPAAAADAGDGGASVALEKEGRNYDRRDLEDLAEHGPSVSATAQPAALSAKDGSAAVRCVERSMGTTRLTGRLVRLIDARFEGTPAYIAVYLEGPGADQPPDTSAVYVASKGDCRFLSTAAAKL